MYSLTKNDKVSNWSQEMHAITPNIEFEYMKGKNNVLADSLSRLRCLGLHDNDDREGQVKNTDQFLNQIKTCYIVLMMTRNQLFSSKLMDYNIF